MCYDVISMATPERPSDEELARLVSHIARRFIQRWDCYPLQLADGRYVCVKKPLTTSLLIGHLTGKLTWEHISSTDEARPGSSFLTPTMI